MCKIANSAGYHHCIAHRKPFLTQEAVKKCYAWAQENKGRDWDTIIWMDEPLWLQLEESVGQECDTWKAGEELLPENIRPMFQSGQKSIMFWGCVAQGRKGPHI